MGKSGRKIRSTGNNLRTCEVLTKDGVWRAGFLFIDSSDYLVLANNIYNDSLMGPLKQRKIRCIHKEADFTVFPREKVCNIKFF